MQTDGAILRDAAIETAISHADHAHSGWSVEAYEYLCRYAEIATDFTCEDVRLYAEKKGLPKAPTARAWGGIMRHGSMAGVIRHTGIYRPISDPSNHLRPVAVWESCLFGRVA